MRAAYKQRSIVITPAGLAYLLQEHVAKCETCKRKKAQKQCATGNALRLDLERAMERFSARATFDRPKPQPDPEYQSISFNPQCRHERTSHDINQCDECRRHSRATAEARRLFTA